MTVIAPPCAPLECPRCSAKFDNRAIPCHLVANRLYVECSCGARLWLYLGGIDENGVGKTHLVDLGAPPS